MTVSAGRLVVSRIAGEEVTRSISTGSDSVSELRVSTDGKRAAICTRRDVCVFDLATGDLIAQFNEECSNLAISPDGTRLALQRRSSRSGIEVRDVETGRIVQTLEHPSPNRTVLRLTADNRLFVGTFSGRILARNLETGAIQFEIDLGRENPIQDLAIDLKSGLLAVATEPSRVIRILSAATGEPVRRLNGHHSGVSRVVFHPDGSRLASASRDSDVRLWDPLTGRCMLRMRGHRHTIRQTLGFSPDGHRIVTQDAVGLTRIWNARPTDAQRVAELVATAEQQAEARDFVDAIDALTQALTIRPNDSELLKDRGELHGRRHDWPAALADFHRTVELQPDDATALSRLAHLQLETGEIDAYEQTRTRLLELFTDATSINLTNTMVIPCLAVPHAESSAPVLAEMVQRAVPPGETRTWHHATAAKLAYRTHTLSVWLNTRPTDDPARNDVRVVLVRAMSAYRSNPTTATHVALRECIGRTIEAIEAGDSALRWHSYLDVRTWLREAESLLPDDA